MRNLRSTSRFIAGAAAVALCGGFGVGTAMLTGQAAHADEASWAVPTTFPVVTPLPIVQPPLEEGTVPADSTTPQPTASVPGDAPHVMPEPIVQPPLPTADEAQLDENVTDLATDWPTAFDRYTKVSDHEIRAYFRTGTEHCFGAYGTVQETPERVIVTVHTGLKKDAPQACTMNLRGGSVLVKTKAPIGDREIVDGALPQPK